MNAYKNDSIECARLRYAAKEIANYLGLPAKVQTFHTGTDSHGSWTTVLVKYPHPSRWLQVLSPNEQIKITQGRIEDVKEAVKKILDRLKAEPQYPTDRVYEEGSDEYARLELAAQIFAQRTGYPAKVGTSYRVHGRYRWTTVRFYDNSGWADYICNDHGWSDALSLEEQERIVLGPSNEAAEAIQKAIDWNTRDRMAPMDNLDEEDSFYVPLRRMDPTDMTYEKGSFEYARLEEAAQTIAQRTGYPARVLTEVNELGGGVCTSIWAKLPDYYTEDTGLLRWSQVLCPDYEQVSIVLGSPDEAAEAIEKVSEEISGWVREHLANIMQQNNANST